MRPLGYVLLAFNLLAAGALVYFYQQDWKGRQEITAGALRHIILLRGLPYDGFTEAVPTDPEAEVPLLVEMSGNEPSKTVGPEFLKAYFKDASGGDGKSIFASTDSVASQRGELKRVRQRLKAEYDAAAPAARLALLAQCLEFQPESYAERALVRRLIETKNVATLAVLLDMKFRGVDPKLIDATGGPLDEAAWGGLADRIARMEAEAAKANAEAAELEKQAAADLKQAADAEDDIRNVIGKKKTGPLKVRVKDANNPEPELRDLAARLPLDAATKFREALKQKGRAAELLAEANLLRLPEGPTPSEGDLKTRTAHLLVHLDPDAGWQKRVMVVVGVRQYAKAVAGQALRFRQMADQVERLINQDQRDYDSLLAQYRRLAIQRTQMLMEIESARDHLEKQKAREEAFVAQRKTQLDEITKLLAAARNDVSVLLAEQTGIEKELYTLQRDIAVTLDDVYELQEKLAEAERQRFRP
ncbi:MAG: hypothetical protein K2P78_11755 [Gemmataceae bacterium]|nr:hypothetical protein [Gemmataceae bacterium]